MPVRNGYKSHNGRSAVARKVLRGGAGKVNGMMPQKEVWTLNAGYVNGNTYFGGPKKGGLAPTATGFMRPNGVARRGPRGTENYLFEFAGYSAQKALPESDCQGNCEQGLDYLVKSVWSWSFFMDEYANVTYTNTDPIQPSVNASFIVDKVSAFTKSNLSPAPSTNGLHWLHRQSQDRYVISFSDDNNHNFSDKAPAILIGDTLHFAIGSNHGWHPESQWNNGEFFSGKIAALASKDGSAFNGNIVWSRPLNSTLATSAISRAVTLNNNENDEGPNGIPRVDNVNTQSLYEYINPQTPPLSSWDSSLVGSPYKLDVAGYYGNAAGGNAGNMPFIDKVVGDELVLGISPVYNKLYITFAEFNICGQFYIVLDGYYANWSGGSAESGSIVLKPSFHSDLAAWKAKPDVFGRKKEVFISIGGPQFQPYFPNDPNQQIFVANYQPYGAIPSLLFNSPFPSCAEPQYNTYPDTIQLRNGLNYLFIDRDTKGLINGIDNFYSGRSRYLMGQTVYNQTWGKTFKWFNSINNRPVQLSAEASKEALDNYQNYLPGGRESVSYKFQKFALKCFNTNPDEIINYELVNYPIEWIDKDGISQKSNKFIWSAWSDNGTPGNWQDYGTGDYSTMSAWEYALRIVALQNFGPASDMSGAIIMVPASSNSAVPGKGNIWDYNLLAKQIFVQGTPAGLNNATMRKMRENKPIIQVAAWCIESDASTNGNFTFTNAMKALLNGTAPPEEPWCAVVPAGYPNASERVCCPQDIPYKQGNGSACHDITLTKRCALWGYPTNGEKCSTVP